jgi:hypothetical protein
VVSSRNSVLKLAELEKKDVLSYCHPPVSTERYFWFSVGIDASVVHTDLNVPVYDWRISFNSILRLENKLPYEAEYAIWEISTKSNMVEKQHGIVPSGGSVFIYSADIRKPIYLTLFLQNGWILEKVLCLSFYGADFKFMDYSLFRLLSCMNLRNLQNFFFLGHRGELCIFSLKEERNGYRDTPHTNSRCTKET